ncbi:MAG: hypothetical protein EOP00_36980 [Pedobacter sp.]|nr:MAG: hypothetical protein EOP00_36980 [Pedobacter sp.]
MQQFFVEFEGKKIKVAQQENGKFVISHGSELFGEIYPEPGDLSLVWKSKDKLDQNFVSKIGELITAHEMGRSIL